jgi:hypothetical protein
MQLRDWSLVIVYLYFIKILSKYIMVSDFIYRCIINSMSLGKNSFVGNILHAAMPVNTCGACFPLYI